MSDLNNKHLPSDIDSLTRKDLVEFSKIQMEEYKKLLAENESLREQLETAKAENVANFCAWLIDNGEPIPEEDIQRLGSKYLQQAKGE